MLCNDLSAFNWLEYFKETYICTHIYSSSLDKRSLLLPPVAPVTSLPADLRPPPLDGGRACNEPRLYTDHSKKDEQIRSIDRMMTIYSFKSIQNLLNIQDIIFIWWQHWAINGQIFNSLTYAIKSKESRGQYMYRKSIKVISLAIWD